MLVSGAEVIVVHRSVINHLGKRRDVITDVLDPEQTAPIFHDDMTVEVSTARDDKIIKLKPGEPVVHKYVLYNGPNKVRLLNHLRLDEETAGLPPGAPAVDASEVAYYLDDLHLDTLTDYPTSWMGRAFSTIGLTQLVIWFTNLMHSVLWWIYSAVKYVAPPVVAYGLCILLLTVLVRGLMHPVSRKQARTTMRMQALKPELDKLKEKFKDDKQGLQMAQMELYRKHGINPLGSCWMLFLQMPVFLGLYYCLQESIHFRLAPFLWIKSLTAPDMLFRLPEWVPFINKWENYGAFYYLGPFFNVLPVIAVVLMVVQQKYTMPPATDEQTAMQQKWMKYSMILFGIFFYKVAAGLCLYFIASSLWGFAERKLLPKKKPGELPPPVPAGKPTLMQRVMDRLLEAQREQTGAGNGAAAAPPPPPATPPAGGKRKRGRGPTPTAAPGPDGLVARLRAWWAEVLKQAAKK
jgi:YidC/Oxa1 family membrane protein insertase